MTVPSESITPDTSPTGSSDPREMGCGAVAPVLLRAGEAAQALAIGRSAVYTLIRAGELASVRIGGSRRIPRTALLDYVDRLRAEQPTPGNNP